MKFYTCYWYIGSNLKIQYSEDSFLFDLGPEKSVFDPRPERYQNFQYKTWKKSKKIFNPRPGISQTFKPVSPYLTSLKGHLTNL